MAQQAQEKTHLCLFRNATLGIGAYGQVCRAKLDELPCAAKLLHPILVDRSDPKNQTNLRKFEQECRFLSEIHHPNIVQYLGMVYDSETGLPVLLMELMDESLTHFLERSDTHLPYHVQVDISHDITLALVYLHSNDIIHRDLSSNNVLLIRPGYRAKVTDFGMSKFTEMHPHMTPLTKCPGTQVYMAPEALQEEPLYTAKLDVFQAGVLMVQIITRKFPDPTGANRKVCDPRSPTGIILIPVTEIERRCNHLTLITDTHSMMGLIRGCLKDEEKDRPTSQQLCKQVSTLKEAAQYSESRKEEEEDGGRADGVMKREREVEEREREVEGREREVKSRERVVGRRVREVEKSLQLNEELQRELEEKERLLVTLNVQAQQIQERCQQVENQLRDEIEHMRDEKDQVLREKDHEILELLGEKDRIIHELSMAVVYICQVSGPGLRSATVNYSTHVTVKLRDNSGKPCLIPQMINAELKAFNSRAQRSRTVPNVPVEIAAVSPSLYNVSFTAMTRGQHKLHIQQNSSEINGSPFTITVYPDPTQLGTPERVVAGLDNPYDVAVNSHGDVIVSEWGAYRVSVLDSTGKVIRRVGDRSEQINYPAGVAVDRDDNVYVASEHKLQKFSRNGHLIKTVGQKGNKEGEFNLPLGVRLHNSHVYICDKDNNRIQVFDCELNFIRTIGSTNSGKGALNTPFDLDFDAEGNAYIVDYDNRVLVLDTSGQFIREFGHKEGKGRLEEPTAIHIIGEFVYVSDSGHHRIAVYETSGKFVTSFGREGKGVEEFDGPCCITSDHNGFIYVCDSWNSKIKIL